MKWDYIDMEIVKIWKIKNRGEAKKISRLLAGDKYLAVLAMKTNDKLLNFIKNLNQSFPGESVFI